jgi:hypothetical protein
MTSHDSAEAFVLDEATRLQEETIDALKRIQDHVGDAEEEGALTLEQLRRQHVVAGRALDEADRLNEGLDETKRLQNKLSRWTLTFGKGRERDPLATRPRSSGATLKVTSKSEQTKPKGKTAKSRQQGKENRAKEFDSQDDILKGVTPDNYNEEFQKISDNDREIDGMLDETAEILGRLEKLSQDIEQEVSLQGETINQMENKLETAHDKQEAANSRARRFLTGKWRRQGDQMPTVERAINAVNGF